MRAGSDAKAANGTQISSTCFSPEDIPHAFVLKRADHSSLKFSYNVGFTFSMYPSVLAGVVGEIQECSTVTTYKGFDKKHKLSKRL